MTSLEHLDPVITEPDTHLVFPGKEANNIPFSGLYLFELDIS